MVWIQLLSFFLASLDQEPSLRLCLICNSWAFLSWLALGLSTAAVSPSLPRTTRACWISPQPLSSRVLCARSLFAASLMEAPTRATTATGTLVFVCLCTSWTKYTCICTATTCYIMLLRFGSCIFLVWTVSSWTRWTLGLATHKILPVVPARGGAEVALGIYIRPFSSIELACAVRQPSPCVHEFFESGVLFHMSHLKLHFALHASHSTLHTPHFTLHASHCTLHTSHFTLHTPHFTLHSPHFTLHSPHFTLHTPHFTLHSPHFTLHTPHFTLHSSRPTLHTAPFTLHTSSHLSSSRLIPAHLFSSHLFSYVI